MIADKQSYDTVRTRVATGPEFSTEDLPNFNELDQVLFTPEVNLTKTKPSVSSPAEKSPTEEVLKPSSDKVFIVQVGAFSTKENAERTMALFGSSIPVRSSRITSKEGKWLYRVKIGPYTALSNAEAAKKLAIKAGFADAHIVEF